MTSRCWRSVHRQRRPWTIRSACITWHSRSAIRWTSCAPRDHLAAHGVELAGQSDHHVSQSLYCHDPDGILIELYVDADPALWRDDPGAVAHIGTLKL